jgi:type IV pilus assembly protein PilB
MGIEPFLIADSLILVCAQRLVKRICKKCIESYTATDEEERITKGDIKKGTTVYKGKGCNYCNGSGYKGRTGIYEVLLMNKEIRTLLLEGATMEKLKDTARKTGMRTLREDAVEKVLKGITTVEELVFSTRKEE